MCSPDFTTLLPPPRDPEGLRHLIGLAYHEAAHACFGIGIGHTVHHATLRSDLCPDRPNPHVEDTTTPGDWVPGSATLILLAGPEAQRRVTGQTVEQVWAGNGWHDHQQALGYVGEEGVGRIQRLTEQLVSRFWAQITDVAVALLRSPTHTLTGAEIEQVLEANRPRYGLAPSPTNPRKKKEQQPGANIHEQNQVLAAGAAAGLS